MKFIGDNLRYLREREGLTQDELCEKISLKRTNYSKWEINKSNPKPEDAIKIANYYRITLDDLLTKNLREGTKSEVPYEENFESSNIEEDSLHKYRSKYYLLLEKQVKDQEYIQRLETTINEVHQIQKALFARVVAGQGLANELFGELLKQPEKDLQRKLLNKWHEQIRVMQTNDNYFFQGT